MCKSSRLFFLLFGLTAWIICVISSGNVYAGLFIKLVAVNASADQSKDYQLKYYLPKELKPEDVLDLGGMEIDYDIDKQSYFVYGTIPLEPKESKTISVEVKDVWKISNKTVEAIKKQIDENVTRLQSTDRAEAANTLKEGLMKNLNKIVAQQENYSENIERRIEEYRANAQQLNEIKDTVSSVEYWDGQKVSSPKTSITSDKVGKTVKLVIDVENPNKDAAKVITQKHYLPKEIRAEDVIDSQGFDIRYDEEKQQSYLSKEEEFQPGESKHYEIQIKDIWHIPNENLENMQQRAQSTFAEIEKSEFGKEYLNNADGLLGEIKKNLGDIQTLQKEKKTMKQHIGAFRVNQERYGNTEADIDRLERILAMVRQKRLEQLEKSRVKNILQKLKSLKGIEQISKAVFGQKISVSTTWKIIWGTLIFIAIFTAIHFITWWQRSQAAKLKELEKAKAAAAKA